MTLSAQTKANRQNAKKSTGPKSKEGKAIVSKNAVTHGAYVQSFMNKFEEEHYRIFLAELHHTYPSDNPLIKSQLERFAKVKTILDRIQRTVSATFEVSESTGRSDESIMDLLQMDENQRKIARDITDGILNIDGIINVRRIRVASELANIDTSSFTNHDDFLYHTPLLCKYLFDEAEEAKVSIDRLITHNSQYPINSDDIINRIFKIILKREVQEMEKQEEIDIYAPYPPPKTLETEIHNASLANLHKAAELFKEEHNKLADLHHKVITFNKLRKFEVSPIPLNFDQLDKLLKFQNSLQNQYSKILGELLAMTSNG